MYDRDYHEWEEERKLIGGGESMVKIDLRSIQKEKTRKRRREQNETIGVISVLWGASLALSGVFDGGNLAISIFFVFPLAFDLFFLCLNFFVLPIDRYLTYKEKYSNGKRDKLLPPARIQK